MTTAIAKRMCGERRGSDRSDEVTLSCILDRLSRLEHEGFSYDELLHDFASRRCVGPVNQELPASHVADPAEETDEVVQAYLSLTRRDCSGWSRRWASSCNGPHSELENLQRIEQATRIFSTRELERSKPGGLYSTISRRKVGLVETDIDDLTATPTSRADVLAATERTGVAKSLAGHSDGVLAGLLKQKTTPTLPTVNPACFRAPLGSRSGAPGSPKRPRSNDLTARRRNKRGGSSVRGLVAPAAAAAAAAAAGAAGAAPTGLPEEGLEPSKRLRVLDADESQHRELLADNVRRLRALLGESGSKDEPEGRRAGSPSLFSVHELRVIGAAERQRKRPNTSGAREDGPPCDKGTQEARSIVQEGVGQPTGSEVAQKRGAAAELAVGGNTLLRKLAKDLFSSIQFRIQNEFLVLFFQKWKETLGERAVKGYLDATLLIQCSVRRRLATMELAERRRLRDVQARQTKCALELEVQRRQASALRVQKWIRGQSGRRRARKIRRLLHAARTVQRATRLKNARARARRWRKEQRRIREAEAKEEQREKELTERLRKEIASKVEALTDKELLLEQRYQDLQERFRREGAATRIQACWRARVLKRNLSAVLRIGKRTRAIRIQRNVRVWLAKSELQRRKEANNIRFAREIAAAIKIQTLVRRRIAWNKVDERRFERSKEELVSTMDAERALRVQRVQVPRIKALAVREGPVVFAEGKGKPYVVDPVALKVMLVDKKRAMNPWQESTDRNAATKIQALYRGYRQVVRIRRMRVQRRREYAENRRKRQFEAANNLQRVFRGKRARVEAKSRRYGLRAVRVQKVWRGFLGRRVAADRRQQGQAATVLQRRLRGAQARALTARMRREAVTTSAPALAIQSAARRYLARRRFNRLVRDKQIEWEWSTMAAEMGRFCAERARLRVIVEGAAAPNCKGDGVTQFIFRKIAVKRSSGREGSESFRLEGRAFNKLFASTPGAFSASFRATDVDLVFARVKDKDEKTLTYEQFASALNVVAATLFPDVKRFRDFRAFKAKAARLLELVEGKVLQAPGAAEYRKFCQKAGERFLYRSACRIQATVRGHIGRQRFKQKRRESNEEARMELEGAGAVKIQTLGRRYCARCRAIRLAQARISKYIDPNTQLPYWVNPATGVTTWTKPKVFGAEDVKHPMMVATSKTEHLVKCSVCDVNPVKRMCTSCRDSYCEDCFLALHGKGKRRTHVAPVVPMCCVCKYQHATRVCETCTFKTSSTCAYCDVCFFNRHPGLDILSKAEASTAGEGGGRGGGGGAAKAWAVTAARKQDGWNHRWRPLVVICIECRRYAARWLCDDCEEVYCVGCYASVHRHGTKVKHGAEKLPYYTVDLHMEYAMACRKRSRKERDEEARLLWLEAQARAREVAAVKIQARWRGRAGRIEGRAHMKATRAGHRAEWRQRKQDDRKRKALWYEALDLAGLAPRLASDRVDEMVLKRIPRMARKRPRKYIALNREDDAWVPGKLDGRKGIVRRGFDFGKLDDLKDQAKRGGVRLPGGHSVVTGHRCIYTDPAYNMGDFVKRGNVIRVYSELFHVEAIEADRIRVDRVWHKRKAERVLLYKMVLNPRQKLLLRASKAIWSSQAMQYGIQVTLVVEEDIVNRLLRKAAKRYKRKRKKRLYTLAKKTLKKSEEHIESLKLKLNSAQFGLDNSLADRESIDSTPDHKESSPNSVQGTAESDLAWVEQFDEESGRPIWRNTVTGDVTLHPPKGMKNIEKMTKEMERQKELMRAKKAKKR
eukprot:g2042.t1